MKHSVGNYRLILASNSPRRKELLSGLDLDYEVKTLPDIEESYPDSLQREEIPLYLARLKADAYRGLMRDDTLLITADTIVWLNGKVYGKPADREEAIRMLQDLSGQTHEVLTGVCLTTKNRQESFFAMTKVRFSELELSEIEYYIDKYKPYDKAGAYGVQEWIGYVGVEYLEGSFYNVMGLPVRLLYAKLKEYGFAELK
ncbi:MAG: Maf-like protein [Dysgonamonadaceae bacterium]|jgi:septum formation protein|nr:Maf-like protein [Dysgonamonadaceae bacterium]